MNARLNLGHLANYFAVAIVMVPPAQDPPAGWHWTAYSFLRIAGALVLLYMTIFGEDFGLTGKFNASKAFIRWAAFLIALGLVAWVFLDVSGTSFLALLNALWGLIFGSSLPIPTS